MSDRAHTRAVLAARRAALAKRSKVARAPRPPLELAGAYESALRGANRDLARTLREGLGDYLGALRAEQRADARAPAWAELRVRLERLATRRAEEIVARFAPRVGSYNRGDLEDVLRIDLSQETPDVARVLESWRRENVDLITSIAKRMHGDVRRVVREGARNGTRVEDVAREIGERFNVSASRATLIARDQILKANADLTRVRCVGAGVTRYRWSTSRDERVRGNPTGKWPRGLHYALEGREFSWDDPPVVNLDGSRDHPGRSFQCRCVAVPLLD